MTPLHGLTLALLLCASQTLAAAPAAPGEQAIRELLVATDARKVLESTQQQLDGLMRRKIDHILQTNALSDEQRKVLEGMHGRVNALLAEELTWERLEPMFIRLYRESFTPEEVDGMLAFYRTPAGQAMVRKLPVVLRATMKEMELFMSPLMEKMRAIEQETFAQLRSMR